MNEKYKNQFNKYQNDKDTIQIICFIRPLKFSMEFHTETENAYNGKYISWHQVLESRYNFSL